jgi:RNA polymerase sigma-70 factor (ECF subfamily)
MVTEQQFLELYDAHVGKIYRYIYFRVNAEELAQDLTSEVFLKSWQYLSSKSVGNPRAFFYQIARNLITDFYRKKDKMPIALSEITDRPISDKSDSPLDLAAVSSDMTSVKQALRQLSPDYQEIVIWRYLDELETKEIAEILNKSEGAVRTLLSRALGELRGKMQ